MPRCRSVKYGTFTNEQLACCSIPARLCFIGLWTLADWQGRMECRPMRIKMLLFPADSIDVGPLLDELEAQALILRYVVDGSPLLWIPKFAVHQKPHKNEMSSPSLFPPHPADTNQQQDGNIREQDGTGTESIGSAREHFRPKTLLILDPESLILNPDSSLPEKTIPSPAPAAAGDRGEGVGDAKKEESWKTKADPLLKYPRLLEAYPKIEAKILELHPHAKLPTPGTKHEFDTRLTLAQLVSIDKHTEEEVLATLKWVVAKQEPGRDGFLWREHFQSIKGLRNITDGMTKFGRMRKSMLMARSAPVKAAVDDDLPEYIRKAIAAQGRGVQA